MKRSFTLIELVITMALFVIIVGVASYVFHAVMFGWSSHNTRAEISIDIDAAFAKMVGQLRRATQISSTSSQEVRFTTPGGSSYVYYIYGSELKKTTLTGGIAGSFTYGAGEVVLADVLASPTSSIGVSGNMVNLDLSVGRGKETVRSKIDIRPRNL